ncbi:MAG: RNA polymerase subunit sigma, partial [Desulfobacterales bacterium]
MNIYLREMGTLTLLSHEDELKLARKMEEGKNRVQTAVLTTPLAIPALNEVVRGLDSNSDKICQVISGLTDNEPETLERESSDFLERVAQANTLHEERVSLLKHYLALGEQDPAREDFQKKIDEISQKISDLFQDKMICTECIKAIAFGLEELSKKFRKVFVEIMGKHVETSGG